MDRSLFDGRVQRLSMAHVAGCEVVLLQVRQAGPPGEGPGGARPRTVHVVLAGGMGVGVCDGESRARLRQAMRAAPSASQAFWRARLEGTRLVGLHRLGVTAVRDGQVSYATTAGRAGGALALGEQPVDLSADLAIEDLADGSAELVDRLLGRDEIRRREAFRRSVSKALGRVERRIRAVEGDLLRMHGAQEDAERATAFVASAARAPRGTSKLEGVDWSTGEPRPVEMAVDPAFAPRDSLEGVFRRARRLKQGALVAGRRLEDARFMQAELTEIALAAGASDAADLGELEMRARAAAPKDFSLDRAPRANAARGKSQAPLPSYRTFLGSSGARLLVGRGAAHNDALTFHVARPHDLWLHARGHAGAHVVVPLGKNASCPAETLVEAAHLAAHFSDARDESLVEVVYTHRRYVRKPTGSPPGRVVAEREKVIVLRRQADLLRGLLERETTAPER